MDGTVTVLDPAIQVDVKGDNDMGVIRDDVVDGNLGVLWMYLGM